MRRLRIVRHKAPAPAGILVRTGSVWDRIILRVPLAFLSYQHARVGQDCSSWRILTFRRPNA